MVTKYNSNRRPSEITRKENGTVQYPGTISKDITFLIEFAFVMRYRQTGHICLNIEIIIKYLRE